MFFRTVIFTTFCIVKEIPPASRDFYDKICSTLQSPTDSAGVQRTPLGPTGLQECHILSHICHILSHICDNMSHIFVTFCYILLHFVTFCDILESDGVRGVRLLYYNTIKNRSEERRVGKPIELWKMGYRPGSR